MFLFYFGVYCNAKINKNVGLLRLYDKKVKTMLIFMGKNKVLVCQPPIMFNELIVPIIMQAYEDSKWS